MTYRWFNAEMLLHEGAGRQLMSSEYTFQSTEIGKWDKNNKNPHAITYNYLETQNFLKRAEKREKEKKKGIGMQGKFDFSLQKRTQISLFFHTNSSVCDTSKIMKLLLETALPNNK